MNSCWYVMETKWVKTTFLLLLLLLLLKFSVDQKCVACLTWYYISGHTLDNFKADTEPGSPPQSIKGTLIEPWPRRKQLFAQTLVSCAVSKIILLLPIKSQPRRKYKMGFVCTILRWCASYSSCTIFSRRVSPIFSFICLGISVKHKVSQHNQPIR